jgi:mxaJ protein
MSSACSLLAIVCATALLGAAATPPLRICADPNNMPFSNQQEQGFENRIAALVGRELHRPLSYVWWPQRRGFLRNTLDAGRCDVVIGMPARPGSPQTTRAYYRSTYAFVSRRDRHLRIDSFDDSRLRTLTIGIQIVGDDYQNPPAAQALASRHLVNQVRGYTVYGDYDQPDPQRDVIAAVADRRVDVAVVWGPIAGYFARRQRVPLDVVPVTADSEGPALRFAFDIAMTVRRDDAALRQALDGIIAHRRTEIHDILRSYGVPLR